MTCGVRHDFMCPRSGTPAWQSPRVTSLSRPSREGTRVATAPRPSPGPESVEVEQKQTHCRLRCQYHTMPSPLCVPSARLCPYSTYICRWYLEPQHLMQVGRRRSARRPVQVLHMGKADCSRQDRQLRACLGGLSVTCLPIGAQGRPAGEDHQPCNQLLTYVISSTAPRQTTWAGCGQIVAGSQSCRFLAALPPLVAQAICRLCLSMLTADKASAVLLVVSAAIDPWRRKVERKAFA